MSKFSQSWVPLFRKADTCDVDVALDRVKHLKMVEVGPDHLVLAETVVHHHFGVDSGMCSSLKLFSFIHFHDTVYLVGVHPAVC